MFSSYHHHHHYHYHHHYHQHQHQFDLNHNKVEGEDESFKTKNQTMVFVNDFTTGVNRIIRANPVSIFTNPASTSTNPLSISTYLPSSTTTDPPITAEHPFSAFFSTNQPFVFNPFGYPFFNPMAIYGYSFVNPLNPYSFWGKQFEECNEPDVTKQPEGEKTNSPVSSQPEAESKLKSSPKEVPKKSRKRVRPEDEQIYEVERILAHRDDEKLRTRFYLVKWLGYDEEKDNTWQSRVTVRHVIHVKEYEESLPEEERLSVKMAKRRKLGPKKALNV